MAVNTDESILIRECAPLYASFALESLANFLLGCSFCYLVLLIACKNQLENPGRAAMNWATEHISWAFSDWYQMMKTWTTMPELPLDQRLAFCRKLNLGICITQVMSSFLAITRWLHFGNINGFRYLGYSVTCSFLQAELVILIAPYVPLFKTNVIGVMLITFSTMIAGWVGSLEPGWLYEDGSLENFAQSWDLQDILWTAKGYKVMPAWICLGLLIFIQIPVLALIFVCKSGLKPHRDLPFHYLRLILLVELTWPCFGIWWFLSSEGEGVIHDTKANTFGFCLLNMLSKGGFTLMMLQLSRDHRRMWIEDCAVTPKAKNEDLWIVRHLRPYESTSVKYSEEELEDAVARALARHGINVDAKSASSPFAIQTSQDSTQVPDDMEAEMEFASKARAMACSAYVDLPVLLEVNTQAELVAPRIESRAEAARPAGQDDWWPCSCAATTGVPRSL